MSDTIRLTEDAWEEHYKPIPNPLRDEETWGGAFLETFGDDMGIVFSHVLDEELEKHVWTIIDCDGLMLIVNGNFRDNRIGYLITEEPWVEEYGSIEVLIDDHRFSDLQSDVDDEVSNVLGVGMGEICELLRVALNSDSTLEFLGKKTDLSDETLVSLRDTLNEIMEAKE